MKKILSVMSLFAVCGIVFISCSTTKANSAGKDNLNRKWMLKTMDSVSSDQLLKAAAFIDLTNIEQGRGKAGCNNIMFKTTTGAKNAVQLSAIAATKMFCEEFMKLEAKFTEELNMISAYEIKGHFIKFKDQSGKVLIEAVAADWD